MFQKDKKRQKDNNPVNRKQPKATKELKYIKMLLVDFVN